MKAKKTINVKCQHCRKVLGKVIGKIYYPQNPYFRKIKFCRQALFEEIKGVNCWICQKCLIQDPYNDNTKLTIINKLTKKKRCLICKMQLINKKAMIVRAKHEYEKIIEVNYYCPSCFSYS